MSKGWTWDVSWARGDWQLVIILISPSRRGGVMDQGSFNLDGPGQVSPDWACRPGNANDDFKQTLAGIVGRAGMPWDALG